MASVRDRAAPEPRPSARHNCRYALMVAVQNVAPERRAEPRSGRTYRHIRARGARHTDRRFWRALNRDSVRCSVRHSPAASKSRTLESVRACPAMPTVTLSSTNANLSQLSFTRCAIS